MDHYAKAIEELQHVEHQLQQLAVLQRRRDQLRQFVDLGRAIFAQADESQELGHHQMVAQSAEPPVAERSTRRASGKHQIIEAAKSILSADGPMSTRMLLERLLAWPVDIGGADKLVTVSVVLSRAKDTFKSDRSAGGWTLTTPHKEETPPGAPTPAGS